MKAQAYMILAVFLIISVLSLTVILQKPTEYRSNLYDVYSNIKNEMIKSAETSLLNEDDYATFDNFIWFAEQYLDSRGYAHEISYAIEGENINVHLKISEGKSYIQDDFIINRLVV